MRNCVGFVHHTGSGKHCSALQGGCLPLWGVKDRVLVNTAHTHEHICNWELSRITFFFTLAAEHLFATAAT